MLRKSGSSLYRANLPDTVTIAAIARDNGAVESANFIYPGAATLTVEGHPGCRFDVKEGIEICRVTVLFSSDPNASYDLAQVDDSGKLVPLDFSIPSAFGPAAQFRVEGLRVPVSAPRPMAKARKAARKKARKPAKKTARKGAKKKTAKKKAKAARKAKKR